MPVLIVVAHPDDETIGMGGTIARHVESGEQVYAVHLTNGVGARGDDVSEALSRGSAASRAAKTLGFEWAGTFDFPDNRLDTVDLLDIVKVIERVKSQINPTLVYTHHFGDLNVDHRVAFEATLTAFRPQPGESCLEIRTFEVPSATDYGAHGQHNIFIPNLFIDVEKWWHKKKLALDVYGSELRSPPHSRSLLGIETLAQSRGVSVGLSKAEAFCIVRKCII